MNILYLSVNHVSQKRNHRCDDFFLDDRTDHDVSVAQALFPNSSHSHMNFNFFEKITIPSNYTWTKPFSRLLVSSQHRIYKMYEIHWITF